MHHLRTALSCCAALALAAGCGQSGGHSKHGDAAAAAKPASIEQLASKADCKLSGKRASRELRQGVCQSGKGRFVMLDFTTDNHQRVWLEEAKPWGGSYLVGTRWVVVGTPKILEGLRPELGGKVLNGRHHG
ncbi:hypothetical protein [Spirillospora sp. CA-294931]|uniref:hypothetical protein n=1 Tax=Spirillospora sp. CA-294931 TaxID=3240042 RepID=UPI003D942227